MRADNEQAFHLSPLFLLSWDWVHTSSGSSSTSVRDLSTCLSPGSAARADTGVRSLTLVALEVHHLKNAFCPFLGLLRGGSEVGHVPLDVRND